MLGHPPTCPTATRSTPRRPAAGRTGTPLSEVEAGQRATIYRITEEAEEDAGPALVPRGAGPHAGRPRHDPRPLGVARLADARGAPRPGDAGSAAGVARPRPPRRGRPGALPPRPGLRPAGLGRLESPDDDRPRPDRAQPDRPAPHRDRPDGPVQLPPRPPHRRHVHPPPRGHRRRPLLDRLREGHPRRAALAGPALGRGPGGRRRGRPRAVRAVPPDGAPAALRGRREGAPRPGRGLSLLLHAGGARRRAQAPGGGEAAAALQRPLRAPDRRGARRASRPRAAPARSGSASARASSPSTTSSAATSRSTSRTSAATS